MAFVRNPSILRRLAAGPQSFCDLPQRAETPGASPLRAPRVGGCHDRGNQRHQAVARKSSSPKEQHPQSAHQTMIAADVLLGGACGNDYP